MSGGGYHAMHGRSGTAIHVRIPQEGGSGDWMVWTENLKGINTFDWQSAVPTSTAGERQSRAPTARADYRRTYNR